MTAPGFRRTLRLLGAIPSRGVRATLAVLTLVSVLVVLTLVSVSVVTAPPTPEQPAPPAMEAAALTAPRLRAVDGGPSYYDAFSYPLPTEESFFPLAVWFESVTSARDTALDREVGLNTYVELSVGSDLSLVRDAGMYAAHSAVGGAGEETVGWFLADEADLWGGAGDSGWTGNYPGGGEICFPARTKCGYSVQATLDKAHPADGRMRIANYGRGVTFWQTDQEAARFVNEYQDVVSADNYWFTDRGICGPADGGKLLARGHQLSEAECHRAANYGATVDRVRSLVQPAGSKPVWAFIEVGQPFAVDSWPAITGEQVAAAVWSSLIHGARGIIYFNHSFGGSCKTEHVLRDACYTQVRAAVRSVNARVTSLAPVLNADFVDGLTTVSGEVDLMTKLYQGDLYVFAGSRSPSPQAVRFTLPCLPDSRVDVVGEDRTLRLVAGSVTDSFADGNAVHIYRLKGARACGLPGPAVPRP